MFAFGMFKDIREINESFQIIFNLLNPVYDPLFKSSH